MASLSSTYNLATGLLSNAAISTSNLCFSTLSNETSGTALLGSTYVRFTVGQSEVARLTSDGVLNVGSNVTLNGVPISVSGGGGGGTVAPTYDTSDSLSIALPNTSNNHVITNTSFGPSWAAGLFGNNATSISSIKTDVNSNVYVSGSYTGSIIIYNKDGVSSGFTLRTPASTSAFAVKYDSNGTYQWAVSIDGGWSESGHDMDVDNAGNLYLLVDVRIGNNATIYDSNNTASALTTLSSGNTQAAYLVQYNPSGIAQHYLPLVPDNGNVYIYPRGVAVNRTTGHVYTTGFFDNLDGGATIKISVKNSTTTAALMRKNGSRSSYLVAYNSNCDYLWYASMLGTLCRHDAQAVRIHQSTGDITIGGTYRSSNNNLTFIYDGSNWGGSNAMRASRDGIDTAFAVRWGSNGRVKWWTSVDSTQTMTVGDIAIDNDNSVLLAGQYTSNVIMYSRCNLVTTTAFNQVDRPSTYVAKWNSNGDALWSVTMITQGTTASNAANALACDTTNGVYVTGTYFGPTTVIYDASNVTNTMVPSFPQTTATAPRQYLAELNPSGLVKWAFTTTGSSTTRGTAVDATNDYVLMATQAQSSNGFTVRRHANGSDVQHTVTYSSNLLANTYGSAMFMKVNTKPTQYTLSGGYGTFNNGLVKTFINTSPGDIVINNSSVQYSSNVVPPLGTTKYIWNNPYWYNY